MKIAFYPLEKMEIQAEATSIYSTYIYCMTAVTIDFASVSGFVMAV
jgi:hypothetical protein